MTNENPTKQPYAATWIVLAGLLAAAATNVAAADDWRCGVAKANITPQRPMWMSGYAGRDKPAQGKLTDLWAKALVFEDSKGHRAALVTLDLIGIDRDFSLAICKSLKEDYGLERSQIALCSSHTHTGPIIGRNLNAMYFLDDASRDQVIDYSATVHRQIVTIVGEALKNMAAARISWANGHSTFAVNRRNNAEANVPDLRARGQLKGPVDYDVPVLAVRHAGGDAADKLMAIVFGYACHATVLSFFEWSGDYPGFAQIELERAHPEALALFFAGCGADQNPLPRRDVKLAEAYGRSLAASVDAVLASSMNPVEGEFSAAYAEVPLAFDKLPTREQLEKDSQATDKYVAKRATLLLEQINAGRELPQTYPYPVQLWRLGSGLQWVTLGGEVVVGYSLRIKRELGRERTWVAGYANDVMAYIPTAEIRGKGYEGGGAMVYYGLPAIWGLEVEETVVRAVHGLK
jgi:neutral ceramidase